MQANVPFQNFNQCNTLRIRNQSVTVVCKFHFKTHLCHMLVRCQQLPIPLHSEISNTLSRYRLNSRVLVQYLPCWSLLEMVETKELKAG